MKALDSMYNPLKMKAIHKWIRKPLFNVQGSECLMVLTRNVTKRQCPFVFWAPGP